MLPDVRIGGECYADWLWSPAQAADTVELCLTVLRGSQIVQEKGKVDGVGGALHDGYAQSPAGHGFWCGTEG